MRVIKFLVMSICMMIGVSQCSLFSMHQRYIEDIDFFALSLNEQSLLVYDAIVSNNVQHLAHYIICGWRHDISLDIESHPTWTALAWAIFFNRVAQVKVLIAAGAHAASLVDKRVTALRFAQQYDSRGKIITLLEQAGSVAAELEEKSCTDKMIQVCAVCCLCAPLLAFVIKEEFYTKK